MSTDPALAAECERVEALQRVMRQHLPREAPPLGLRRRVETAVGMQRSRARFAQTQFSWRALAASIAVTAFVAGSSTSMFLAPRVVDLAKEEFPLVGGRIDVVGEIPVPTLVYAHRKHLISLMAVPDTGRANSTPVLSAVNGYNMYRWAEDGVAYWAVSDVASADFDKLVTLFRTTPPDQ